MQRKSQGLPEPLSTHSSIQILAKEHCLPDVRAYWSVGSEAGEVSGVLFLTVQAEHRTAQFDQTASFTISGTPTAVDRVLLALRAAYAAQIEPLLGEQPQTAPSGRKDPWPREQGTRRELRQARWASLA